MTMPVITRCLATRDGCDTRPAISDANCRLTRAQLGHQVAARRAWLSDQGVTPGQRVVIHLPKSVVSVSILFACLSMGAVAVPVDIRTPGPRFARILERITPSLMVTAPGHAAQMQGLGGPAVATATGLLESGPAVPQVTDPPDEALALILMSSGSTGTPKGIEITHANLRAFVDWAIDVFAPRPDDRFLSIAPLHFDLSLYDLLVSQTAGAAVHVLSEQQIAFPAEILRAAQSEQTSILYTVPTVLQMLMRLRGAVLPDLRWLLFAGEPMPPDALAGLAALAPRAGFANLYGPTETNVITCHMLTPQELAAPPDALPIGLPCTPARVWIADAEGAPLPAGAIGEICAAGPTVSSGYWRQPEHVLRTTVAGERDAYRTGDLGWQADDGTLYFAGRRDRHIKIRGMVVNLDEVENVAMQSGTLSAAAATVEDAGSLRARIELHAIPRPDHGADTAPLMQFLSENLAPAAMPATIRYCETLPQTFSGKIDRAGLADHKTDLPSESA
ncbi:AMP-binding protein [Primorskyibacter sp. 2E107]|uniref:AMP-binding protein n=1 Tax=Primorskyibacter sp. 2E107 TaxID=3403458 RepID=UPI003AF79C66